MRGEAKEKTERRRETEKTGDAKEKAERSCERKGGEVTERGAANDKAQMRRPK